MSTGASSVDGACQQQLRGLFVDVFGGTAGFFGKLEGAVPVGQANHCFGEGALSTVTHAGGVQPGAQEAYRGR